MKKFILGFILAVVLTNVTNVLAASINVVFGSANILVDGKSISKQSIVYNDTTYIPVRAYSEALDYKLNFVDSTKTAYIWSNKGQNYSGYEVLPPTTSNPGDISNPTPTEPQPPEITIPTTPTEPGVPTEPVNPPVSKPQIVDTYTDEYGDCYVEFSDGFIASYLPISVNAYTLMQLDYLYDIYGDGDFAEIFQSEFIDIFKNVPDAVYLYTDYPANRPSFDMKTEGTIVQITEALFNQYKYYYNMDDVTYQDLLEFDYLYNYDMSDGYEVLGAVSFTQGPNRLFKTEVLTYDDGVHTFNMVINNDPSIQALANKYFK